MQFPYIPAFVGLLFATHAVAQAKTVSNDVGLWHEMKYYANYSFAAFGNPCPTPPWGAVVQQYLYQPNTDTQGTIYRDDRRKQFILAFAGTQGGTDQYYDAQQYLWPLSGRGFNCPSCWVHAGFLTVWNSIADQTIAGIADAKAKYPTYTLAVASHSTGAGIASLATVALRGLGYSFITYTFGQPRVGNQAYAAYVNYLQPYPAYIRVTHSNDGTAQWPYPWLGYVHEGTEFWQMNNNWLLNGPADTYRCYGAEPGDCNNSQQGQIDNDAHNHYSGLTLGTSCEGPANLTFDANRKNL